MVFSAAAIAKALLLVGAEVGTTMVAAATRMFTAKFVVRLIIKLLDSLVARSKTKFDDKAWPPFRKALKEEIGD